MARIPMSPMQGPLTTRLDPPDEAQPSVPFIEVRDRKRQDAAFLELDEETRDHSKHYRWVRIDANNSSVAKHRRLGYTVEDARDPDGVKTHVTPDRSTDGSIAIGDVILMSCPKEGYENRMRANFRQRESVLASTTAETERMAKEKGINLIQDSDHGRVT